MPEASALGSLRGQVLRWLIIPLLGLVAANAVSVYYNALDAADLAYDRSLLASTRVLAERVSLVNGKVAVDVPYVALDSFETDTLGRMYYKVSGINGEFVSGYADLPALPPKVPRSEIYPALVHFYHADYQGEPVRIAALHQPVYDDSMRGIVLIQVAESMDARRALWRTILFDTLWRQAALVIAAAALAWIAVRFVLRPFMRLKGELERRPSTDLSGFDPAQVHKEVRPLVRAMNGYMARLQAMIAGQSRFIADASHQLRTPLTVLKTQTELALRETDPHALREIIEGMSRTTEGAVHLANRLLTLARTEHGAAEGSMLPLSLLDAARQVGLEMAQRAVAKGIDLSLEPSDDAKVSGHPLLLHELIANLVDNAIHYTPTGGTVLLRVRGGAQPALEIEDSGPGIAPAERETVFAPFYRAESAQADYADGSGLGLTIVRDIAALHGAAISLSERAQAGGLKATVTFPPF